MSTTELSHRERRLMTHGETDPQPVTGPVSNRTWILIMALTLIIWELPNVWALWTKREGSWIGLLIFFVGVGFLVDVVRRWRKF